MFETKDPYLLLSLVNTKLRDEVSSFEELCKVYDVDKIQIMNRLEAIGYHYESSTNQFIGV